MKIRFALTPFEKISKICAKKLNFEYSIITYHLNVNFGNNET